MWVQAPALGLYDAALWKRLGSNRPQQSGSRTHRNRAGMIRGQPIRDKRQRTAAAGPNLQAGGHWFEPRSRPLLDSLSGCDAPYNRGMVKRPEWSAACPRGGPLRPWSWPPHSALKPLPSGRCPERLVGNEDGVSVSVIDTQTNQVVGSPIGVEGRTRLGASRSPPTASTPTSPTSTRKASR